VLDRVFITAKVFKATSSSVNYLWTEPKTLTPPNKNPKSAIQAKERIEIRIPLLQFINWHEKVNVDVLRRHLSPTGLELISFKQDY